MISLSLPLPPSLNRYYRAVTKGRLAGRFLISEDGRAYRSLVAGLVMQARAAKQIAGSLSVRALFTFPDNRRRDLDNYKKALYDALTHAGVWLDDSQIDEEYAKRMPVDQATAGVYVTIESITG